MSSDLLLNAVNPTSKDTLVQLLQARAQAHPDKIAYIFLPDGEEQGIEVSYRDLDIKAKAVASQLLSLGSKNGDRALMLFPSSLEFIYGFFGCLYAGISGVPAYPPRRNQNLGRLKAIIDDCDPSIVMTTSKVMRVAEPLFAETPGINSLNWLAVDEVETDAADNWTYPDIHRDTLAFLQYTSGSTGNPKGVMVSHGNLLYNEEMIRHGFGFHENSKFISWLPLFHDMGLIGMTLQPFYLGITAVFMSPASFLQKPLRWLQAVTDYQGTVICAPNFAYELSVRQISDEQRAALDLSTIEHALSGAEAVRPETIEHFISTYESQGFVRDAFIPTYGLAEATLMVTASKEGRRPLYRDVVASELAQHRAVEATNSDEKTLRLVSNGVTTLEARVAIVDTQTNRELAEGQVGEIWTSGQHCAQGYWQNPSATEETFQAHLDNGDGPFMRTGDLGCIIDGDLYITGREKDVIIIRGRNHYPQDIEHTVQQSNVALKADAGAAFAIEVDGEERLIVVQEVERRFRLRLNADVVSAAVRQAVAENHELQVHTIVFIKPGKILKTSSGKIQRRANKQAFLDHVIQQDAIAVSSIQDQSADNKKAIEEALKLTREEWLKLPEDDKEPRLVGYLQAMVANEIGESIERIKPDQGLMSLGIDSLQITQLFTRLRDKFDVDLELPALFDAEDFHALAATLADSIANTKKSQLPELTAVERNDKMSLSFSQKRMWFFDKLHQQNVAYNLPFALKMQGALDVAALEKSFESMIKRHEIFRTVYVEDEGHALQVVQDVPKIRFDVEDLSYLKEPALSRSIDDRVRREARKAFDLELGPVIRAELFRLPDMDVEEGVEKTRASEQYLLLITIHHIAADGWSLSVITNEIARAYEAEVNETEAKLLPMPLQYVDFAQWQKQLFESQVLDNQLDYWTDSLRGVSVLDLPTDHARPPEQSFKGANYYFSIPKDKLKALKQLSRSQGVTLYMSLLASYKVLLHHYTQADDICVGTPIANRSTPELEQLIGFFVNTLALRTDLEGNPRFTDFLTRVRKTTQGAFANQDMPFERVVEHLGIPRDMSYSPVFQVMFVLQNSTIDEAFNLAGVNVESLHTSPGTSKFDMTLQFSEESGVLYGDLEYATDLFEESTIIKFVEHYLQLVESILADPATPIGNLNILTDEEKSLVLSEFNNTDQVFPMDSTMHGLFEAQVATTPDAIALVYDNERLTYAELNNRANRMARHLQSLGVANESLVGVCQYRTTDLIVSLLAILKAGGAYVPLDPAYPADRVAFMLEDAQAPVLLTQSELLNSLPKPDDNHSYEVVAVDQMEGVFADYEATNLDLTVDNQQLGYVIYTSGSTGKPKGVMISHSNAAAMIHWAHTVYSSEDLSGVLAATSICFDLSVYEIFVTLAAGGKIILAENVLALPHLHAKDEIKLVNTVPSAIATLQRENAIPNNVQVINLAGEALSSSLVDLLYESTKVDRIYDLYGPSEDTTYSTFTLRRQGAEATIGRPIANTHAYLLNKHGALVPPGIAGELYLSGTGVTRGYRNRDDLTAEKYLANNFETDAKYQRMYRTGDLARYYPNGNLEYLGRIDHQVKVRGFRIELGEIETAINSLDTVQESLVIAREDAAGHKALVAYLVTALPRDEVVAPARAAIKADLPDYMMPAVFITLDALPLTPNGKVDRAALPAPAVDALMGEQYVAPRNESEEKMAAIWQSILGLEKVGVKSDFFELGGHSLLATQCMSRIRDVFGVDLPVKALFTASTIEDLCQRLESGEALSSLAPPPVDTIARDQDLPLSFAQQRLWFLNQFETGDSEYNISTSYNMPAAIRVQGNLDTKVLKKAFQKLVERHESLRTSFLIDDGRATQVIREPSDWFMDIRDLCELEYEEREAEIIRLARDEATRSFDLILGPINKARRIRLMRTRLLKTADQEYVLLLTMHHIISDGWSLGILIDEIAELYSALKEGREARLPELKVQYADYAKWQRDWMDGPVFEHQLSYWKQHLEDVPVLELPTDKPRPPIQTFNGAYEQVKIPAELTARLNELSHSQGATLFMTLLAGFYAVLQRYSGQEDICVGTPVANRAREEFEKLIGCFVNTLALRVNLEDDPRFVDLLMQVEDVTLNAYAHQDLPFERLVDSLGVSREKSHSPLFQVMFTLQNASAEHELRLPDLDLELLPSVMQTAKFDLTLNLTEKSEGLVGEIEYNTDLFNGDTVHRMVGHFETILEAVVAHPHLRISELPLLTEKEKQLILSDWNHVDVAYEYQHTIHGMVEQQVEKSPDAIALSLGNESLTYQQLNERANQLAHWLRSHDVKVNDLVGISLDRSLDMVVAILGVLKAGGAYVPVDPANPADRKQFILEDANCKLLLSHSVLASEMPTGSYQSVWLDHIADQLAQCSSVNPEPVAGADDRAYVIYTSGTTGKPKGVLIPHGNVIRLFTATDQWYGFDRNDVWTLFHSFAFDFSVWEIWGALFYGGRVVVVPQAIAKATEDFYKLVVEEGVTVLNQTPSAFSQFIKVDEMQCEQETVWANRLQLRYVIFGGEALDFAALQTWNLRHGLSSPQLINMYGITETTVHVTYHRITEDDLEQRASLIGRPIPDLDLYILDKNLNPVPVGVPGELHVGGQGVCHGYLNRDELTTDRFISSPFATANERTQGLYGRLYKTGDLGRYLSDGTVEYLGRIDHQVKVRGYRIELGEIESSISQLPGVRESVVQVWADDNGDKQLVAYVVADQASLEAGALKTALRKRLPEYMVPAFYVMLDQMPLTGNGKVDKKALPDPEGATAATGQYVAPRNDTEEQLVAIWQEVLNREQIGIKDNFFDIGGHSLLATQIVSRIREQFNVELALSVLFEDPTVEGIALHLLEAELGGADEDDLAAMLAEIEGLSADDLENL
ncbi:MAG: amino acid adenylation domain-containing protein [Pseudomonadales bacterium]|nr:amino acid adenylation domain-containing protein [Pseudomonadales bacterium]